MRRLSLRCRGLSLLAFGRLGWVKLEGLLSECHNNIQTEVRLFAGCWKNPYSELNSEIRWKKGNLRAGSL